MSTKPTEDMTWATDTNYSSGVDSGTATKVDPGAAARAQGVVPDTGAGAQHINHLLNAHGKMVEYLEKLDFLSPIPIEPSLYSGSTFDQGQVQAVGSRIIQPTGDATPQQTLVAAHTTGDDILRSHDGISWVLSATIGSFVGVEHARSVFYSAAAGLWIIGTKTGSTNPILTASDPVGAWTARTDPQVGGDNHGGMAESATNVVMPGTIEALHSTDGITWSNDGAHQTHGRAAIFSPSLARFVIVGDGGKVMSAEDADVSVWTDRSASVPAALSAVDFVDGAWDPVHAVFVVVGAGGKLMTSTNGTTTWVDRSIDGTLSEDFRSICSDGAGTLYAATERYVLRSTDGGQSWLPMFHPSNLGAGTVNVGHHHKRLVFFGQSSETAHQGFALGLRGAAPFSVITP